MREPIRGIDHLKRSDVEKLNDLVIGIKGFVLSYPGLNYEDYIQEVVERIEEIFDGKIDRFEYVAITQLLQRFARIANRNDEASNQHNVNVITAEIINIIQGDDKMNSFESVKRNINAAEITEDVRGDEKMNSLESAMIKRMYRRILKPLDMLENAITNGEEYSCDELAKEYSKKIFKDVFGGKIPMEVNLVDKYYEMDPETEDLLNNATFIVDGMVVLIENPAHRENVAQNMTAGILANARMKNRWCTVTQAKISYAGENAPTLSFVAVYEDGVKRKVIYAADLAWLVKKDSIPRIDEIIDTHGEGKFTGPIAKVLEVLETMPNGVLPRYSVKVGDTDLVMPSDQYIICEGDATVNTGHVLRKAAITDTEIFDEDGLSVLSGTVHDIQKWAMNLPSDSDYLDYRLRYAGYDELTTVRNFLVKPYWDGKE